MAIKKRSASEKARDEAIEAFGNAAEPLLTPPAVSAERGVPVRPSVTPTLSDSRDKGSARTMLLRFDEDRELMELLAVVAKLEGRKKHPMALRALRIGLEQVRDTYE
ncbi:hypothetical protein Asphe3_42140 (plasmid) [Pseudarthrobacter phenanthrenivorans Sphe3]|uniref:Uncharacterized protein n=1 Tax=Pseudarthrobacter phenanthrenivorans (strain DSM 18606 / JCM 16027 / LMG 23796 / Sphe3) TaxID=930171 RepID=F0MCM3_PSEPM|nr:hypothetical protein [Pseudarthrobacter phenanthrenivorans]ADX75279.1 hypothetical protein Asphe3_42140 [Pseudarthrobacter phenanthrenivorans Sphe3]